MLETEILDTAALETDDKTLLVDWLELAALETIGELVANEELSDDALDITELLDASPDEEPPQAPKLIDSTNNNHNLQCFIKRIPANLHQRYKVLIVYGYWYVSCDSIRKLLAGKKTIMYF